ncbi:MAG: type II secretion system ATPase GspE [Thiohalomonadales bacterium]|nr:type II secretion system ATPase GspE [Thiohalomonadales bacterium]
MSQPAEKLFEARLPFSYAKRHGILITGQNDDSLEVVCLPSIQPQVLLETQRHFSVPLKLREVTPAEFDQLLQQAYEDRSSQTIESVEGLGDDMDLDSVAQALAEPEDLIETEDDAPIIRLINALLTQAIRENASDIHIEPFESRLVVRFRVDGVLREVLQPKRALAPLIVSRVKVMAKLDIAEKRVPQDGRISLRIAGRAVDVRVSTLPSGQGERVVMRILDKQAGRLDLEQLGMDQETQQLLDKMIHRPHGIILVTGPTGSGKTTTLYAILSRLNTHDRNIMTVEEPIEYYLDGIGQTQVNPKVDLTFARGLRAILRQDPDVVMVGEIRDLETVTIAIQASLTGHMVFSTLHTNTAIGAITRLRDMGVEPFLLSSSMVGILAQRLVRTLCPHCKQPYEATETELKALNMPLAPAPTLYRAVGCDACNQIGYRGRTGIYELINVDNVLRDMIHKGDGEQACEAHARITRPSLFDDGLRRILKGDTSVEEVLRVTQEK